LADVSARCGIDEPALSRLENRHTPNPALDALLRDAAVPGKQLVLAVEDVAETHGRGWLMVGARGGERS